MEKIKELSFSELYTILKFLKSERNNTPFSSKDRAILENRIGTVEEELRRIINNLF